MSMSLISPWPAFDPVVAAETELLCRQVAARLRADAEAHARAAGLARPDWSGPHRDAFDDAFAVIQRTFEQLADDLDRLAMRVAAASAEVAAMTHVV